MISPSKTYFQILLYLTSYAVLSTQIQPNHRAFAQERLDSEQAGKLAELALQGIEQEYPNKPGNVIASSQDVTPPREHHPVFYGCFDWHSSVHGHWLLVRMLKVAPKHRHASASRALLDQQLTHEKLLEEANFFDAPHNRSFERMYGWAWTLRLVAELHDSTDPDLLRWRTNILPLETKIVSLVKDYLPKLTFPIRTGQHADTGFALAQMLDYARAVKDEELENMVVEYALAKYSADTDYPARYEPSGHDFFSTCLNEADLMRRVLSKAEFSIWLNHFLPDLGNAEGSAKSLLTPALVSDVTDGKLVHLAGLNFNRGWTQAGICSQLDEQDQRRKTLEKSINAHRQAGMQYVFSGHYEGEHWLATFAAYLLTDTGL